MSRSAVRTKSSATPKDSRYSRRSVFVGTNPSPSTEYALDAESSLASIRQAVQWDAPAAVEGVKMLIMRATLPL